MKNNSANKNWFIESLHQDYRLMISKSSMVYSGKTAYQSVEIFQNDTLGKVLILDGIIQLTEADEANYHEMMSHVPLFSLDSVNNVLIIGGADGGVLREVVKHQVNRIVIVDIDGDVVDLCKAHLPSISKKAFDDKRVELLIKDGVKFIALTKETFDVVIIDSTDPVGPGEVLFTNKFYSNLSDILSDKGIVIFQGGVPFLQECQFKRMNKNLKNNFKFHGFFFVSVPTYSGGMMALGWASNAIELNSIKKESIEQKVEKLSTDLIYYNANIHASSFAMPESLKRKVTEV